MQYEPAGTTLFYIEPSGGTSAPSYPDPGAVMWDNYRITITDPLGFKEEYYYSGLGAFDGWYRDKNQYLQGRASNGALTGPRTRYQYTLLNGYGVVSSITYADGNAVTYSNFNAARQPQTITNANGKATQLTYNSMGRVLTRADARNVSPANQYVTTYTYAPNNVDLVKVTDFFHDPPNHPPALQLGYDSNRNLASITDGLGRNTTILYNQFGQPDTVTDATTQVRTYHYNSLHQFASLTQNGNTLLTVVPDDHGRPGSVTNVNGYTLAYSYDDLNRLLRVTYPDATYTENQWGCCHLDGQRDRSRNFTSFGYDEVNRPAWTMDAANRLTQYEYDPAGNLMKLIDANRNTTRWEYNNRNLVAKKIYADNSSYLYDYDGAGNLWHQTDAKGVQTTFGYDQVNNLTTISAPGLTTISYLYDSLNRRYQMTDGTGTTLFGYDLASQLKTIDGPSANDTFNLSYDALGRFTGRDVNGAGASALVYDNYGRPQTTTNPLGIFTYNYPNAVSTLLSSITVNSASSTTLLPPPVPTLPNAGTAAPSTTFSYWDAAHDQRPKEIWHQTPGNQTISKFDYEYDVLGRITKWTTQTDTAAAQAYDLGYDLVGQLKSAILKDASQAVLKSYNYDYNAAGNRTLEAIDTLVTSDTPNNLNQLKTRQGGAGVLPIRGKTNEPSSVTVNGSAATVKGDNIFEGKAAVAAGNNTVTVVATDANGNATTNRYNVVVSGSGSKTLTYDPNGNLIGDGTRTFEWDPLNRLTAVTSGTHRSEFTYNGLSQRVKIVEKDNNAVTATKNLIGVGSEIFEERDATNNVTKRYYAQGMQVGPANLYYTRDHLGSVRELTDSSGAVQARYDYDPYGRRTKLTGSLDADFGFTGFYFHSQSGLNFSRTRAYDADLGRWISRDPIEENGGMNLYRYVQNSPAIYVDPSGENPLLIGLLAAAIYFSLTQNANAPGTVPCPGADNSSGNSSDLLTDWLRDHLSLDLNLNVPAGGGNVGANSTGIYGSGTGPAPGGIAELTATVNVNFGQVPQGPFGGVDAAIGWGPAGRLSFGYSKYGGLFFNAGVGYGYAAFLGPQAGGGGYIYHWKP